MKIIKVKSTLELPKKYYPFSSILLLKKSFPEADEVYQYTFPSQVNPDRSKRGSKKLKNWGFYVVEVPEEKLDELSPNSVQT